MRADLESANGRDPLPGLSEALELMRPRCTGVNLQCISWELARRSLPPAESAEEGAHLIESLRAESTAAKRLPLVLLEVAEVLAQAQRPGVCALAMEAARSLRRGRTTAWVYLPDALVRCARLLRDSEPREAASLVHVATRWVYQALPHVPLQSRERFVSKVAVNRLLLDQGSDLHAEPVAVS
jgi:hypothetical protein